MVKFWPKFWPSFANTFPMWGKLFQIFLDPDKKSLGPLKDLDGLIDEVLALDSAI